MRWTLARISRHEQNPLRDAIEVKVLIARFGGEHGQLYSEALCQAMADLGKTRCRTVGIGQTIADTGQSVTARYLEKGLEGLIDGSGSDEPIAHWRVIDEVHRARGQLREALAIHTERQLPAYQKLGDVRSVAVTWESIARIFVAQRQLDDALAIYESVLLPFFGKLGDSRSESIILAEIASIYALRGRPEEALKIYKEREPAADRPRGRRERRSGGRSRA